jgi:hypothetical protein
MAANRRLGDPSSLGGPLGAVRVLASRLLALHGPTKSRTDPRFSGRGPHAWRAGSVDTRSHDVARASVDDDRSDGEGGDFADRRQRTAVVVTQTPREHPTRRHDATATAQRDNTCNKSWWGRSAKPPIESSWATTRAQGTSSDEPPDTRRWRGRLAGDAATGRQGGAGASRVSSAQLPQLHDRFPRYVHLRVA